LRLSNRQASTSAFLQKLNFSKKDSPEAVDVKWRSIILSIHPVNGLTL
jgi:hypothetical protein